MATVLSVWWIVSVIFGLMAGYTIGTPLWRRYFHGKMTSWTHFLIAVPLLIVALIPLTATAYVATGVAFVVGFVAWLVPGLGFELADVVSGWFASLRKRRTSTDTDDES